VYTVFFALLDFVVIIPTAAARADRDVPKVWTNYIVNFRTFKRVSNGIPKERYGQPNAWRKRHGRTLGP
jgi:hypothetical protein